MSNTKKRNVRKGIRVLLGAIEGALKELRELLVAECENADNDAEILQFPENGAAEETPEEPVGEQEPEEEE